MLKKLRVLVFSPTGYTVLEHTIIFKIKGLLKNLDQLSLKMIQMRFDYGNDSSLFFQGKLFYFNFFL